ncbi:hypothetical protein NNC41_08055 [Enterococcus faecium]|nr:hypothetical protein [Enterococcus faecium]HAQ1518025.1 hypothetical protein [Enterococcus faecium]
MVIDKEKKRKYVTLKKSTLKYLESRVESEEKLRGKNVTISELLEELVESDRTIRKAFMNK